MTSPTDRPQADNPEPQPVATTRARRINLAAFLSFVWPGLGQAYRGQRAVATLLAAPPALLAIAVVGFVVALGPAVVAAHLFNPAIALSVMAASILLALWRGIAVLHAAQVARAPASRWALVVVLLALIALPHSWVAYSAWSFVRAGEEIYEPIIAAVPSPAPGSTPAPTPSVPPSTGTPSPSPEPLPGVDRRVTVLLVGVDKTGGPASGLTDTLIVASFDPVDGSLVMISLPRDTARLPYYRGGTYNGRINSLMNAAQRDPDAFPDGPMGTLVNEVAYLTGIGIDYYAQIDIAGFKRLIDLVGGVDVHVQARISDPVYQFSPTEVGFTLEPGIHHLDGKLATAYARSRHGPRNSDYERAGRQQQILLALRDELDEPWNLANLPGMLEVVSQIIRTDAPLDRWPEIVAIGQQADGADVRRVVLSPPRYASGVRTPTGERTFANELNMDAVAELSIELFGDDSRYSDLRNASNEEGLPLLP